MTYLLKLITRQISPHQWSNLVKVARFISHFLRLRKACGCGWKSGENQMSNQIKIIEVIVHVAAWKANHGGMGERLLCTQSWNNRRVNWMKPFHYEGSRETINLYWNLGYHHCGAVRNLTVRWRAYQNSPSKSSSVSLHLHIFTCVHTKIIRFTSFDEHAKASFSVSVSKT